MDHIRKLSKNSDAGALAVERIEHALNETSLRSALHGWLYRTPINGSQPGDPNDEEAVDNFLARYAEAIRVQHHEQSERLISTSLEKRKEVTEKFEKLTESRAAYLHAEDIDTDKRRTKRIRAALIFIESYRDLPLLAWPRLLIDAIVEVESQMVMLRYRYARAVERIIGRRVGTGGSSGVNYLDKTTSIRFS